MAIEFQNVWQNAAVSQRCIIVRGKVNTKRGIASVIVWPSNFPPQRYPMVDGIFKALVPLEEGSNKVKFQSDVPGEAPQTGELVLRYLPIRSNLPIHFVLLLGKDSPGTFDVPPYKLKSEGNNLNVAVKKLRLASYMMSAFTQEQMNRNGNGFRSFTPYSEVEEDTLSDRDNSRRETTHVHVIRSSKTVAEIRDPDSAQQNPKGKHTGDLFGIAYDALKAYGGPFSTNEMVQAAVIFVDTHWDTKLKLVVGHAALGGNINNVRLAIFGGHTLHAWPTCLEQLPAACLDETLTDTNYVANDAGQSGTSWEAMNVGMGAFQHEVGHLLGCPHEPDGIMLRGYLNWNRSFCALEGWSQRKNARELGNKPSTADTEDWWNRLDIMRFLYHPSFRLPGEGQWPRVSKAMVFPVDNGVEIRVEPGVFMIELQVDNETRAHFEYELVPEIQLSIKQVQDALPSQWRGKPTKLVIHSAPQELTTIEDLDSFVREAATTNNLKSSSICGQQNGDMRMVELPTSKSPVAVIVWSGCGLDGIEFKYGDGSSVMFGKQGGSPKKVPIVPGDEFLGISVRSGAWVDAAGVVTKNVRSDIWGGAGGSLSDLVPPRGHTMRGLKGWFGSWCNGICFLY